MTKCKHCGALIHRHIFGHMYVHNDTGNRDCYVGFKRAYAEPEGDEK